MTNDPTKKLIRKELLKKKKLKEGRQHKKIYEWEIFTKKHTK